MSYSRTRPDAGWGVAKDHPRGPEGRLLCRFCSAEVPKGRRTFCSAECVHEWKIRTNPGYARRKVLARDKGVCAACGIDTRAAGLAWQADHILEVVEGGGCCGLSNLQTLCTPCHKQKTADLARRRAERRRAEAAAAQGQSLFNEEESA